MSLRSDILRGSALSFAEKTPAGYKGKIINMGIGEPSFATHPLIINKAFEEMKNGYTHYGSNQGIEELRQSICAKLRSQNSLIYGPSEIIVTPGCKQAVFEAVMSIVNQGDTVIIFTPCWPSFIDIVKLAGGIPYFVDTLVQEGLEERIKGLTSLNPKLVIINSPNNPSGTILSKSILTLLADEAKSRNFFVLSDEIYERITFEESATSIASLGEIRDRVITINGFSKTFAMTGWRLGYAAAPTQVIQRMMKFQQHTITCVPPFIQFAGQTALTEPAVAEYVTLMINEYKSRRDLMASRLRGNSKFYFTLPKATFYLFAEFRHKGMNSTEFAKYLLSDLGIQVAPGEMFGDYSNMVRLSFSVSAAEIEEAINRIESAMMTN